jgi:predicted DsbA family dithiol-disulfide isomerase
MHDRLFANQRAWEPWSDHAKAIGLDVSKFQECLNSGRQAGEIRRDMAEGKRAGVTSTPTFFLAYTDPSSSKVTTEIMIRGVASFSYYKTAIDRLLAKEPEKREKEAKKN